MTGKLIPDFSPIIEAASDAIFLADTQGRLLYLNCAAMTLFGGPGSSLPGRSIFDFVPQSSRDATRRQWMSGQAGTIRTELITGDGRESTVEVSVTPLGPDQNRWCISRDVTAKVRMEAFEDARQAILEMLAGASPLAEILDQARSTLERYIPGTRCRLILEQQSGFDADGRRQADCTPAAGSTPLAGHCEISPGVTIALSRVNAEAADDGYSYYWSLRSTTEGLSAGMNPEIRLYRGDSRAPDETESAILDRAYGLVRLALQHERLQNQLRHQAHHDPLTGLPNRALLMEFLDRSIQAAATQGTATGLLFIDLDEFKLVNDTAGHGQGDRLLAEAARRMQDLLLRGSMLARMGGDEFTVVIPEVSKPEDAETVARHILRAFSRPFEVNGREQFVSASIGLCFYPEDAKTPSDLLRCADVAVYRAKAAGKGLFRRYNASMNRATERQLRIQNELHRAIEREELSLDYQAQFSMEDRALTGAEALLRWNSAALGPTGPSEFIPVAETSGLVIPVGKWALDRVCRQIADWELSGRPPIAVAVNVSAIQFAERDFLECIWSVLQKHQIDPSRLVLELTESSIMRDYEESAAKIGILRQIGVSVAIDDFGTGYSSLSSLERLHPDSLKIDKSFIQRIAPSEPRPAIVKAIIGLAHSLGMRVVAEGIETDYQLETLREFGCHAGQGYLLSAPLAGEAFQELLSA